MHSAAGGRGGDPVRLKGKGRLWLSQRSGDCPGRAGLPSWDRSAWGSCAHHGEGRDQTTMTLPPTPTREPQSEGTLLPPEGEEERLSHAVPMAGSGQHELRPSMGTHSLRHCAPKCLVPWAPGQCSQGLRLSLVSPCPSPLGGAGSQSDPPENSWQSRRAAMTVTAPHPAAGEGRRHSQRALGPATRQPTYTRAHLHW